MSMDNSHGTQSNILLIVLDSVRAKNTSLYNYEKETTPFLESLADQFTVYEQARSPGIWTLPSHVSIFTGKYPHNHGVNNTDDTLEAGHTIWETLENSGYSTGLFTSNPILTEMPTGIRPLFETVAGHSSAVPYSKALTPKKAEFSTEIEYVKKCLRHNKPGRSLINGVVAKTSSTLSKYNLSSNSSSNNDCTVHTTNFKQWLDNKTEPWAACLNFMDAHLPYRPEPVFNKWGDKELEKIQKPTSIWDFCKGTQPWWKLEAMSNLYDGSIRQIDSELAEVIEYLKNVDEFENTHIIIVGDHGEGLGEHCYVRPEIRYSAHAYGIHDSLLHVPLLSKRPCQQKGKRVPQLASLTSVYDAFLTSAGLKTAEDSDPFVTEEMYVSSIERPKPIKKHLDGETKSMYRENAFAVYRDNSDSIRKFAKWGDDEAITTFARTPQAPILTSNRESHDEVDQMLNDSQSRPLCKENSDPDNIHGDVIGRLEDLGYA